MDDIAEQLDFAEEYSEAISNPVGFGQDVDEVSSEIFKKISV
jgi:charged multivesicular body protein 4